MSRTPICSLLIANGSEVPIRFMHAASEMGMRPVEGSSQQDRHALHRCKSHEWYPRSTRGSAGI